jgi:hypothetical protein
MAPESAVEALRRWEEHGAVWRVVSAGPDRAIVELCTCYGEPVELIESDDPALLEFLSGETRQSDLR